MTNLTSGHTDGPIQTDGWTNRQKIAKQLQ